ncbi:dipeptidase [Marilutibacter alkalisoli]|uniref:Peptidase M19 n=1 Tax=Marilutibacter alkalisoli TaxID=2591633 RepID=A0A514BNB9_9GAMM|nr:membrane dipeptidase [Lysobacter alkalisoli]QDH68867.1 peptidase M19 [Lysobacter alkalisoli]
MRGRREFLKQVTWSAAAPIAATPLLGAMAGPSTAWPPYADTMAIDGASGLQIVYMEEGDPAIEAELQAGRASGLTATLLTVAPSGRFWLNDAAFEATRANIRKWQGIIDRYPDHLSLVRRHDDLVQARASRRLGVIFGFQGTEPLGEDVDRIPLFRDMGVRVIQLTHNRRNLVGDGCMEPGNAGLSNYGRQVVERLNAERIVVDLAHGSQRTMREGIEASQAPVLISHTGCRALADLPRNTGDEELRAMAERGGVAGIIFWPYLRTDTQPMAIDVVHHIEHAVNVCGEEHVGIGTDIPIAAVERTEEFERNNREFMRGMKEQGIFARHRPDDLYTFIPDLNTADRFDTLAMLLSRRGHSDRRIAGILGGNFARVMRDVWG